MIGGVEEFVAEVGLELARFGVPRMRGVETDGQAKRLSVSATIEKLQRLIPKPRSRVRVRGVFRINEPLAGLSGQPAPEIEINGLRRDVFRVSYAELADEPGPITRGP